MRTARHRRRNPVQAAVHEEQAGEQRAHGDQARTHRVENALTLTVSPSNPACGERHANTVTSGILMHTVLFRMIPPLGIGDGGRSGRIGHAPAFAGSMTGADDRRSPT